MDKPDPVLGEVYAGKTSLSPEETLVEFISTSAAFHGITSQQLSGLEEDLLKVLPNNVMPANAAAWYMAKRKYYLKEPLEQQLLSLLLKKFPEKFRLSGRKVIFLEVYEREAARQKLVYLVTAGLCAYFSHKVDEYGVYFFDPRYYQTTEPFHAALRLVCPRDSPTSLVQRYFAREGMKEQFAYKQHTSFLASISKKTSNVKVVTNCTGIIVSMINTQYGFIKFGAGEKALFSAKSLFQDGWQFSGDPLSLPAMKFDGYKLMESASAKDKDKHTWYAVLVWCGRRPCPQYCSSAEDLNSSPMFKEAYSSETVEGSKKRKPSQSMCVGEVTEVRKDGAVVKSREDEVAEVWLPGWRRKLVNRLGTWVSTVDGECVGVGDVVAFYNSSEVRKGFAAVGRNVAVLKENEGNKAGRSRRSTCCSEDVKEVVPGSNRRFSSRECESDSEEELSVSEGELEWLEQDLASVIANEDPTTKTMMVELEEKGYHSGSDEDYHPGDDLDEVDLPDNHQELVSEGDYTNLDAAGVGISKGKKKKTQHSDASTESSGGNVKDSKMLNEKDKLKRNLPFWAAACSLPEVFDHQIGKFVPVDRHYKEEEDPDYNLPDDDEDWVSNLDELEEVEEDLEEEIKCLIEDLKQPVPDLQREEPEVVSPVKVTLTPAKESSQEEDGEVKVEEEVTLVEDKDGQVKSLKKPKLWEVELMLSEQTEGEDEYDPEYVPPSTCLDISLDYDEYSEGEADISDAELQSLKVDWQNPPPLPSNYMAVWVQVESPSERVNNAVEELAVDAGDGEGAVTGEKNPQENDGAKSSATDAEVGQVPKNARKSRCSNLRKKSTSGKSSANEVEADVIVHRDDEGSRANHLEEGDAKKQCPVTILGAQNTGKVGTGDGDSTLASEDSKEKVV